MKKLEFGIIDDLIHCHLVRFQVSSFNDPCRMRAKTLCSSGSRYLTKNFSLCLSVTFSLFPMTRIENRNCRKPLITLPVSFSILIGVEIEIVESSMNWNTFFYFCWTSTHTFVGHPHICSRVVF